MKTKKTLRTAAAIAITAAVIAAPAAAFAATPANTETDSALVKTDAIITEASNQSQTASDLGELAINDQTADRKGGFGGGMGGMGGTTSGTTGNAASPSEITTSTLTENSAEDLTADTANAQTIVISDSNNSVKITEAGTYIITGTCSDGNIAVKKGTTGVVLILKDLDLTSTTGATLSLNKGTEVKVIIEGSVKLTDAENLADEDTEDFDGAAIKAKAGSSVVITGSGTLTVDGSCKHGIKVSSLDEDDITEGYNEASFIIDGGLTINVTAAEDGLNSGTDLTIKSGTINVSAGDDGIKADYILTIGEEGSSGPTIKVTKSEEGLEGATINIYSGSIDVVASDDAINAANSDLTGYTYSLNIMGGTINVSSGADGIDSNGNVNIIGGLTTIVKSASNGGEGGLDYEGSCYIAEGTFVNPYGTTMDSGNGGMGGGKAGQAGGWGQMPGQTNQNGSTGGTQIPNGQMPGMNGETPDASSGPTQQPNGEMPQMPGGGWLGGNGSNSQTPGTMPEMGGQRGGGPGMNGQMPGGNWSETDGQMPGMNGEAPDANGQMPQMPGSEIPENGDGQAEGEKAPQANGETPQSQDSSQNETPAPATQTSSTDDETQNLNWFQKIIEAIKNWFAKTFS